MDKRKFGNLISGLILSWFLAISFQTAFAEEPLSMDQGFQFSARVLDSKTIIAEWQMAPGYFLYRDKLVIQPVNTQTKLGKLLYPPSIKKVEPEFGSFQVYKDKVSISVPVIAAKDGKVDLQVRYQGCSDGGFCYPPTTKTISLDLHHVAPLLQTVKPAAPHTEPLALALDNSPISEQDKVTQILSGGHIFTIVASFLGFGLLLAFTPCVLPMIPILSGIIVGQKNRLTTSKAFSLSLTYVLSMSFTYAIAGILIGYVGGSIQAAFQKTWLLVSFSCFFVLLALSFFGFYELQLPGRLQNYLTGLSNRQRSGSYIGVALMGCIATLIVSPCVTPALVGALGYIGKTGDALLGGSALFALGFGMGIPLLLIGTAGGKLLPKAGAWMDTIKTLFGVLLLAMAIWIIDRVIPATVSLFLWACLLIIAANLMGLFAPRQASNGSLLIRSLAIVIFSYGILMLIGAAMGNSNPFEPLQFGLSQATQSQFSEAQQQFKHIANTSELKNEFNSAKTQNKIVMLDFYAKWCTSCKMMENHAFKNPEVLKVLNNFVTLKADVTQNDQDAQKLEQQFRVVAPPTFLFFDNTGKELREFRIVGEMTPEKFLEHLQSVLKNKQGTSKITELAVH